MIDILEHKKSPIQKGSIIKNMWRLHQICIYLLEYQRQFRIPEGSIGSNGVKIEDFKKYVFDKEKNRKIKRFKWKEKNLEHLIVETIKQGLKEGFIKVMDRDDWKDRIRLTSDRGNDLVSLSGWFEYVLKKRSRVKAILLGAGGVAIIWILTRFWDLIKKVF